MKGLRYILAFLTLTVVVSAVQAQTTYEQANQLYADKKYSEAIEQYSELLKTTPSAVLYYNLGNSYFQEKQYAAAILNYERALLLNPGNENIRFNLEMAQSRIVDKIDTIEPFFLFSWWSSVRNWLSVSSWTYLAMFSFFMLLASIILYLLGRKVVLKKIGFFAGGLFLLVCIVANYSAYQQKQQLENRNQVIIFAPTVTIKSTPDESGTSLFVLHEGTKATILQSVGQWTEIKLADGNKGWIQNTAFEII